jgi:hypothetical protein
VIDQAEFLARLGALLAESGVSFMVSVSIASNVHGEPRMTNVIDIVIDPSAKSLQRFINSVPNDWYVSAPAAMQALWARTMFNVIDAQNGWKADLIIRKNRPFSAKEFERRQIYDVLGNRLPIVTVEDSILSKLEWSLESQSQQQFRDAQRMATVNRTTLDRAYLTEWASQLGVLELLNQLFAELDRSIK